MKWLGSLGALVFAGSFVFAQNTSVCVTSLTDSLTDNTNCTFFYVRGPGMNPKDGTYFAVYEKSVDSTATALYYRGVYPPGDERVLLSMPHVHYQNPKMCSSCLWQDPPYLLFYETDEAGNWDIHYLVFLSPDSVLGPYSFANSTAPETQLSVCEDAVVYLKGDSLVFRKRKSAQPIQWSEPVVLDPGACERPLLFLEEGQFFVAWLQIKPEQSTLVYSKSKGGVTWDAPHPLTTQGNDFSPDAYCDFGLMSSLLTWLHIQNGLPQIIVQQFFPLEKMTYSFSSSDTLSSPSILS